MKKKKNSSYTLFYSQNASPHIRTFKSHVAAILWISKFYEKHRDNRADNWIDCVVEGEVISTYEGWDSYIVDKRGSK